MATIDMGLGLEGTHVLITGAAGFIGTVYSLHADPPERLPCESMACKIQVFEAGI
jgi:hypothetical protein